ncbi:hypothetical protein GCM10027578_27010 [Spirosoma luteolum]
MKQLTLYLLVCFSTLACVKDVQTDQLILDVTVDNPTILADGTSIVTLKADLKDNLDQRKVLFETNKGFLVDSKDGSKLSVDAEMVNKDLFATAKLRAPTSTGVISVSVQMDLTDRKGLNVITKTITASPSVPTKLVLKANSFQVYNNFDSEVEITGQLFNASGGGVSKGYTVQLNAYTADKTLVKGAYRNESLASDNSKISAIYSPGPVTANQYLTLIGTVFDADGKLINVEGGSLVIYVNQKSK